MKRKTYLGWAVQITHWQGWKYLAGGLSHEMNFVWYKKSEAEEWKDEFNTRKNNLKARVVRVRYWNPEVVERKKSRKKVSDGI